MTQYKIPNIMRRACNTFCINRDPMSLAKATVVKKGDMEEELLVRATTAVLEGDRGGCPSPEFSDSERRSRSGGERTQELVRASGILNIKIKPMTNLTSLGPEVWQLL